MKKYVRGFVEKPEPQVIVAFMPQAQHYQGLVRSQPPRRSGYGTSGGRRSKDNDNTDFCTCINQLRNKYVRFDFICKG